MEEPVKHFVAPAEALGGYFFVLAVEPNAKFYSALRKEDGDATAILWTWFCMVHCFVDLAVQKHSSISTKPSRVDTVLASLIKHIKSIGIESDEHLNEIEARSALFRTLIGNYLGNNLGGSLLIGQAIASSISCDVTNPAILFEIGQQFVNLFIEVQQEFEHFELI